MRPLKPRPQRIVGAPGLTEAEVEAALGTLDTADLPPATGAALRLVDRLSDVRPRIDAMFYAALRQALDEDVILELGVALSIASGWQRFIEAFGIRPDGWTETTPCPGAQGVGN